MYPLNATTYLIDNFGDIGGVSLPIFNSEIYNVHIQAVGDDTVEVFCGNFDGGYPIAMNEKGNYDASINLYCPSQLYMRQTAANDTFLAVTYGAPSSTPQYVNGFSYGEIVISSMLFLSLMVSIAISYMLYFRRVKVKN